MTQPINLTPEEIALLDKFADTLLLESGSTTGAYQSALTMIARRRLVLAKHAASAVDICTNNCIQGYLQDTGFTERPKCNAAPALPADVPLPPEGFVYAKFGKLDSTANSDETLDVAGHVKSVGWIIGYYGAQDNYHYAVRIGSDVAARNGLA